MSAGARSWGAGAASRVVLSLLSLHAAVLVALPLVVLFAYAFADRDELGDVIARPSTEAVRRALSPLYLGVLARSLGAAAAVTAVCVAFAIPVAWTIAAAPPRWGRRLSLLVIVPFFTGVLVRAYALMTLLAADGWVAALLRALGLGGDSLGLLYTPGAAMTGLVFVYFPMAVIPIQASLARLDPGLLDAALDLGATPVRAFVHVALPALRPGVVAAITLTFLPAIGMFAVVDLLGGGRAPLVGSVIASALGGGRDWPFGAALGAVLVTLFALFTFTAAARAVAGRAEAS
ncbi:MAG: ABC transporter permease [Polyangiaceae bacterium]|nr:ABC transporter permease [Polyangiaceae bacterium]